MSDRLTSSLKQVVKGLLFRPRGISLGKKSFVHRPWTIHSPSSIVIGDRTLIRADSYLSAIKEYAGNTYRPRIAIGDDVYIGRHCYFTAMQSIEVQDGCVLSEHVYITDLMHGFHPDRGLILYQPLESKGPVVIGAHSFLGYRVSIMPGVTLGKHCVVGANSVVTRSFPDYSMVAGVPARLIRSFSPSQGVWLRVHSDPSADQSRG